MLSLSDKSEAMVLAFRHIVMNSAESLSFSSEERGVGPNGQSSKSPNAVSLSLFEKTSLKLKATLHLISHFGHGSKRLFSASNVAFSNLA